MRSAIVAFALSLAGCALTPGEVRQRGSSAPAELKGAPAAAAECIARNAGELAGGIAPRIQALELGGREVVIWAGAEAGTIAVVEIRPAARGSAGQIYVSPNVLGRDLPGKLTAGC